MRAPDLVEPIIAWRLWRVRNGVLTSAFVDNVWPIRTTMVADCPLSGSPHDRHVAFGNEWPAACGIYALKKRPRFILKGQVVGTVALWGRVVEHSKGYRAQYAYPVALRAPKAVREAYGVPALPWRPHSLVGTGLVAVLVALNLTFGNYALAAFAPLAWAWVFDSRLAPVAFLASLAMVGYAFTR